MHTLLPGLLDHHAKGGAGSPFAVLPLSAAPAVGPTGQGPPRTLINFAGHIGDGQQLERVPLVLTASIFGQGTGSQGPLVGIAAWGSGNGVQQSIEFDIPIGGAGTGGALLAVPCTALTIQARNDGNLIPVGSNIPIGDVFGIPVANAVGPAAACSIGIGPKQGNVQLTRTVWAVSASGASELAAGASINVTVPAWAQRFRVLHFDAGNSLQVTLVTLGLMTLAGPYNEAANAPPTLYPLASTVATVTIKNTGATPIPFMAVVFELGL